MPTRSSKRGGAAAKEEQQEEGVAEQQEGSMPPDVEMEDAVVKEDAEPMGAWGGVCRGAAEGGRDRESARLRRRPPPLLIAPSTPTTTPTVASTTAADAPESTEPTGEAMSGSYTVRRARRGACDLGDQSARPRPALPRLLTRACGRERGAPTT